MDDPNKRDQPEVVQDNADLMRTRAIDLMELWFNNDKKANRHSLEFEYEWELDNYRVTLESTCKLTPGETDNASTDPEAYFFAISIFEHPDLEAEAEDEGYSAQDEDFLMGKITFYADLSVPPKFKFIDTLSMLKAIDELALIPIYDNFEAQPLSAALNCLLSEITMFAEEDQEKVVIATEKVFNAAMPAFFNEEVVSDSRWERDFHPIKGSPLGLNVGVGVLTDGVTSESPYKTLCFTGLRPEDRVVVALYEDGATRINGIIDYKFVDINIGAGEPVTEAERLILIQAYEYIADLINIFIDIDQNQATN